MIRKSVGSIAAAAIVGLLGCSAGEAPPGPSGPTLSLAGAEGIAADVRRTVTEVGVGTETMVSTVDTTLWAPFDGSGAARPSSTDAGLPGPVGWLAQGDAHAGTWSRYGSFVDSAGVLHQLWVEGKGRGALSRMEYWRQGRVAVDYEGRWVTVTGGWVLDAETVTYHPADGPAIRIAVAARQMSMAQASPLNRLFHAGTVFTGLLRPQPLAAQFHFSACSGQWLGWGATALLAEVLWAKFAKTKSYPDFQRAMAATATAGVALSKLVDCMVEQPEQPDPGN